MPSRRMSPRESIGLFSWPSALYLALRPDLSSRSIRATVDAANERSGFSLASEFTFATRIDPSTHSTRTPVDAANGRSGFSFPFGSTFAPRSARLAATPPFVTPRKDLRFLAPSTSVGFNPWRPGLNRNVWDHGAGS